MSPMLTEIQEKIRSLCIARYQNPGDFNQFSLALLALGVVRQTYDGLENTIVFYSKNQIIYRLFLEEIDPSSAIKDYLGNFLDLDHLKKAILRFDNRELSVIAFHRELARAGIIYVSVFIPQQKIYYLSQDGEYFIENY